MQSQIRNYLLQPNKSNRGIISCNMNQSCQNNILIQQVLSEAMILKQKKTKISLRQFSGKIKREYSQTALIHYQNMRQNQFMSPMNPEKAKKFSKKLIQQTSQSQNNQYLPRSAKSLSSLASPFQNTPSQQAYSSYHSQKLPTDSNQQQQNGFPLFRNVFDCPQIKPSSKQPQHSYRSQKLMPIKPQSHSFDLCKSQSFSPQNEQKLMIINQLPELSKDLQISFAISFQCQPQQENKQLFQTNDLGGCTSSRKLKFLQTNRSFISQYSSYSSSERSIVVGNQEQDFISFKNQLWNS